MTPIDVYLLFIGLVASVTLGRLAGLAVTRWHRSRGRNWKRARYVQDVVRKI